MRCTVCNDQNAMSADSTENQNAFCIYMISIKREAVRFSFHYRKVFKKCIGYIGNVLIHFREISYFVKSCMF